MITTVKIVHAHASALYWKTRVAKAENHMRKHLETLATMGSGKHETEHGFFTVSENNKYPANLIKDALSPEEIALCEVKRWSNERARVLFPEAFANAKQREGYKVSI